MAGNYKTRLENPIELVQGPLVGENLLKSFKAALLQENVFRLMFGDTGQRIFENKRPSLNETIVPALILSWRSEAYTSGRAYLDGSIDALLVLPVRLGGDYNSQRRVANMLQRFMGGAMRLWDENPGLTMFGKGMEFSYGDIVEQDGFSSPLITFQIPYRFDLQFMENSVPGFDPLAALDDADVGFLESVGIIVQNEETLETLMEVQFETGQENPVA